MARSEAVRIAILWHMHQPNYQEPHSQRLAMPWVRLHALKDYLDMPLTAAAHENIKVTFNLVPSLLDQLELYLDGGTDRHLELSRTPAEDLSAEMKRELIGSFFMANPPRMILPYPRYHQLHQKHQSAGNDQGMIANLFSSAEIRDLQVWSNLTWIDPMFRTEEPVRKLFDQARHFTEPEKQALLDWQLEFMGRIIPTYKKLQDEGRLEVSFTPYYHPILPLLCDTNSATEALPHVELPGQRFVHPEDAERQVSMAVSKYRELFDRDLVGMWPSEGSVSEEALAIIARQGIKWAASDEEVLAHSITKSGLKQSDNRIHRLYEYDGSLKLLFRDHALSDRIGFVYSTWDADRAVEDFIDHLKRIRSIYIDSLDQTVIPIILDGENAWEYFPDDGREFLNLLYERLSADREIEMLTLGEAAAAVPARPLPSICAGSWINHNFRIWIGHAEDNAAWDLLSRTRADLVSFEESHPEHDPEKLAAAWRQIYIAEGSDWCWWYGDDHRSEQNEEFDQIFRRHLIAVYEVLGLDIPLEHSRPIYNRGKILEAAMPDALLTPVVDGRITHFYEWAGAGHFDCKNSGSAMHQVDHQIARIFFAYDREQFYIRLDFRSKNELDSMAGLKAIVTLSLPESRVYELDFDSPQDSGTDNFQYAIDDVLEFSVCREHLWPQEFGELGFTVSLVQGGQRLESWPEHEPLRVNLPRKFEEMFWPT